MVYSDRKDLRIYRTINLLYAPYIYYMGTLHNDILLKVCAILLWVVDGYLVYNDIYDKFILQVLRLSAFVMLGPILLFKGQMYRNVLLTIMGASFIMADGSLFMNDL